MNGVHYMIVGSCILFLSIIEIIVTNWVFERKKKQIREQTYQIYE